MRLPYVHHVLNLGITITFLPFYFGLFQLFRPFRSQKKSNNVEPLTRLSMRAFFLLAH